MSKLWQRLMLFGISLTLGVVCMAQIKTTNNVLGDENPQARAIELDSELSELQREKKELSAELEKLKQTAKDNEEIFSAKQAELERLASELEKQQILSGYYDVKGPGTVITIDADPNPYVSLASSHQYILALISYLNNAGVEAISINGQRYTNYTEIVPVLDHINVNGVAMVLPLEIKAIGNSRTIEASLNFVGGIVSQLGQIGYTIDIESSSEIFINKYDGEKQFKYAVPINIEEEQ